MAEVWSLRQHEEDVKESAAGAAHGRCTTGLGASFAPTSPPIGSALNRSAIPWESGTETISHSLQDESQQSRP
jgi:hypothetical protein